MQASLRQAVLALGDAAAFLGRGALGLVYPPHCFACGRDTAGAGGGPLCPACLARVRPVETACPACGTPRGPHAPDEGRCDSCRNRALHFETACGAFHYEDPVRRLLHRLKFEGLQAAAGPLARLALERLRRLPFVTELDAVVPVPMHWLKRARRGHNPSELIARELASGLGLPFAQPLVKVRATAAQMELLRARRLENPKGAFRARRRRALEGRAVLLVDDVMTTAATVAECARALREAGVARVFAFAVARQA